jgi:hypothetical protein
MCGAADGAVSVSLPKADGARDGGGSPIVDAALGNGGTLAGRERIGGGTDAGRGFAPRRSPMIGSGGCTSRRSAAGDGDNASSRFDFATGVGAGNGGLDVVGGVLGNVDGDGDGGGIGIGIGGGGSAGALSRLTTVASAARTFVTVESGLDAAISAAISGTAQPADSEPAGACGASGTPLDEDDGIGGGTVEPDLRVGTGGGVVDPDGRVRGAG